MDPHAVSRWKERCCALWKLGEAALSLYLEGSGSVQREGWMGQ